MHDSISNSIVGVALKLIIDKTGVDLVNPNAALRAAFLIFCRISALDFLEYSVNRALYSILGLIRDEYSCNEIFGCIPPLMADNIFMRLISCFTFCVNIDGAETTPKVTY